MGPADAIALGSLLVAALALVLNYLRGNRKDAARDQRIEDKLDGITASLAKVEQTIDKLDGKTDDHSIRITRIEGEMDNIYRRLDRVESRCERHFGPSLHDAIPNVTGGTR